MKRLLILALVTLLACKASAQKTIAAKDAYKYAGHHVGVTGRVKFIADPGYLASFSYYITTDTVQAGLDVTVPLSMMNKSKRFRQPLKGSIITVYGLVQMNHEQPFIMLEKGSDFKIVQ